MPSSAPIVAVAAASRLVMLSVMAACSGLHANYDTSADIPWQPCSRSVDRQPSGREGEAAKLWLLPSVDCLCRSFNPLCRPAGWPAKLVVWDSMFYMHIAKCGYDFEQFYAFFPLLPLATRATSNVGAALSVAPVRSGPSYML